MSENAQSGHGTLIASGSTVGGSFLTIAELRDMTAPPLTRNKIEVSAHGDADDYYVAGMRRKGDLQVQLGWNQALATHDETTGLVKAWEDGVTRIFKVTFPDGTVWLCSGFVTNVGPSMPVDDGLVADATIAMTGKVTFQ